MFKVHRNLYDAQPKGMEVKIETHEVKSEIEAVATEEPVATSETEDPVKKRKKARKEAREEEV